MPRVEGVEPPRAGTDGARRVRRYAWCYLGGAVLCWAPALYFFLAGSSDWSATPALSRHRNHECKVTRCGTHAPDKLHIPHKFPPS